MFRDETGFETDFGGRWPWGQFMVRGSERLTTRLSELAGLVLAGPQRSLRELAQAQPPDFLMPSGIRRIDSNSAIPYSPYIFFEVPK